MERVRETVKQSRTVHTRVWQWVDRVVSGGAECGRMNSGYMAPWRRSWMSSNIDRCCAPIPAGHVRAESVSSGITATGRRLSDKQTTNHCDDAKSQRAHVRKRLETRSSGSSVGSWTKLESRGCCSTRSDMTEATHQPHYVWNVRWTCNVGGVVLYIRLCDPSSRSHKRSLKFE